MSHLISIITPVHPPSATYLAEAYASLLTQQMPDGWDWQWVVQEDGQTGTIAQLLPEDKRISHGTSRAGGPGVARTMALSRADGDLVKVLDADDQLTPGTLARDINALATRRDTGWTTSRVLDLLPDRSIVSWEHQDPPEGSLKRGSVLRYWQRHGYRLPIHPATLCMRRHLLLALGGWMALPASEDTGLLLALNAVSDGHFIGEPGLLYRKWSGQSTSQDAHTDPDELAARIRIIEARAVALSALVG